MSLTHSFDQVCEPCHGATKPFRAEKGEVTVVMTTQITYGLNYLQIMTDGSRSKDGYIWF